MREMLGFADNGACPVDPTGGETCRKECKTLLITESALLLLWENLGVGGRRWFSCRLVGAKIGICFFWAGVPLHFTICLLSAVPSGLGNLVEVTG